MGDGCKENVEVVGSINPGTCTVHRTEPAARRAVVGRRWVDESLSLKYFCKVGAAVHWQGSGIPVMNNSPDQTPFLKPGVQISPSNGIHTEDAAGCSKAIAGRWAQHRWEMQRLDGAKDLFLHGTAIPDATC